MPLFTRWSCTSVLAVLTGSLIGLTGCSDSHDDNRHKQFDVPTPSLSELAIGKGTEPWMPSLGLDLADFGYEQAEFVMSGTASSYTSAEALSADGLWSVEAAQKAEYRTRLLVYRPADPADFNGTLFVEWLNVSGGTDAAPLWANLHTEMLRRGYAWAGISAQSGGVQGGGFTTTGLDYSLRKVDAERYGELSHPGDSFSYDIYSQGAQVLRHPGAIDPLGGLSIERVIAGGESQSAATMLTWIDAFGPFTDLFDGYFIQSRIGSGRPLSQAPQADVAPQSVHLVRADLEQPTIMVQTETDLFLTAEEITGGTSYDSRQDDTETFRLWEVAGTAHADLYSFKGGPDPGDDPGYAQVQETLYPYPFLFDCPAPVNTGPKHFVAKAALHALDDWIRLGHEPPVAQRLETGGSPLAILVDDNGNARGGVRTPYVDVPVATFGGIGPGDAILCTLLGTTKLFPAEKLLGLYGDLPSYVSAVSESAVAAVAAGFLLAEDAELIKAAAGLVEPFP